MNTFPDLKTLISVLLTFLLPSVVKIENKEGLRFKENLELSTDEQKQSKPLASCLTT